MDLYTEDILEYQFFPVSGDSVQFKVRAPNDAHIALTMRPQVSNPVIEVFIGGWSNTKSVIRRNRSRPDKVEIRTPNILNGGEFRGFWIRWAKGTISVGRENETSPFLSWTDPEPFAIACAGVCTGWGATGTWKLEGVFWASPSEPVAATMYAAPPVPAPLNAAPSEAAPMSTAPPVPAPLNATPPVAAPLYAAPSVAAPMSAAPPVPAPLNAAPPEAAPLYDAPPVAAHLYDKPSIMPVHNAPPQVLAGPGNWVDASVGQIPPGAVVGGKDSNGETMYVARAQHKGSVTPGKLLASHRRAFVPWGGQEHGKSKYQVLVGGPNNWVRTNGSNVPPGAFPGGQSENGETLFVGRVNHKGSLITGKVQKSHGACYISYAGQELGFSDYEILMP